MNENLKESVKHLRYVHFTIIAVCIGLLAAYSLKDTREIDETIKQLKEIEWYITNTNWNDIRITISKNAEREYETNISDSGNYYQKRGLYKIALYSHRDLNDPFINYQSTNLIPYAYYNKRRLFSPPDGWAPILDYSEPSTINEFIIFWNRIVRSSKLYVPKINDEFSNGKLKLQYVGSQYPLEFDIQGKIERSDIYENYAFEFYYGNPVINDQEIGEIEEELILIGKYSTIGPEAEKKLVRIFQKDKTLFSKHFDIDKNTKIKLSRSEVVLKLNPNQYDIIEMPLLNIIFNLTMQKIQSNQEFAQIFPELDDFVSDFDNLSIETAKQILTRDRQRAGESFSFFGASLPSEILGIWGVLILLGIQLYFWLHLRNFLKLIGNSTETIEYPWVALYEGFLPKIIIIASVCLLPVVVIGFLRFEEIQYITHAWFGIEPGDWGLVLFIIPVLLSIVCAVPSAVYFHKLWTRLETAN